MPQTEREEQIARTLAQREDSALFRALTPERQEEFRARLRADLERGHVRRDLHRRGGVACVVQSLVIHFIDAFLLDVPSWTGFGLALVFGSLVGVLWWKFRSGYLGGMLLALPGWLVARWAGGFRDGYSTLFGAVLFVCMCAVAGLLRDLRRDDGGSGL